ncbi:ABC transporter substrate-binding protein [Xanthomonas arboricola]|uniref:L-cystine-binding protein FliY n=1 Tax=Xanthomonas arboricola pv. corylina TaxID=487821 RepID=A0A8D6XX13_9XANT|nr:ABC transporter substrate-binding protein [Xanthomonas arboricola]CAE6688083.1 L-cystine-binding protein FliY [Xanthomonas arboricola pv. corylina]CAE6688102.1 L-cystine-binding protein FliY [Xanthomonas arboricola pv. corylina]CAE6688305.1 L-cystine-binding protein FliY [Xanthomonas arboricola pv. corylina]CAE6688313.1 L-cystine-binding protein FliY [Xanthomonas arboricola pv. corylina]
MNLVRPLVLLVLVLAAASAPARPLEEIRRSGTLIVATGGEFPPFSYFQGSRLSGFEIEITELVARRMGLRLKWKTLGFDSLLTGLLQDRWDLVVSSHGVTAQRARAVTFTHPHYCSGSVVVARDPNIRSAADLTGRVVGVQTGSTYLENLRRLAKPRQIRNFPQDRDARTALASGRTDAWVTDRFVALAAVASDPRAGLHVGDLLLVEHIAAATQKGNAGLAAAYDRALAQVMADGSYAAVSRKYFDQDIRCK